MAKGRITRAFVVARELGIEQKQLADRVGMSRSRLSRCLRGLEAFTETQRLRVAQALGQPAERLFAGVFADAEDQLIGEVKVFLDSPPGRHCARVILAHIDSFLTNPPEQRPD